VGRSPLLFQPPPLERVEELRTVILHRSRFFPLQHRDVYSLNPGHGTLLLDYSIRIPTCSMGTVRSNHNRHMSPLHSNVHSSGMRVRQLQSLQPARIVF
jgi:hypothetical protein